MDWTIGSTVNSFWTVKTYQPLIKLLGSSSKPLSLYTSRCTGEGNLSNLWSHHKMGISDGLASISSCWWMSGWVQVCKCVCVCVKKFAYFLIWAFLLLSNVKRKKSWHETYVFPFKALFAYIIERRKSDFPFLGSESPMVMSRTSSSDGFSRRNMSHEILWRCTEQK